MLIDWFHGRRTSRQLSPPGLVVEAVPLQACSRGHRRAGKTYRDANSRCRKKESGSLLIFPPISSLSPTASSTFRPRIRACLKQTEFAPVSVVEQITVLLALTEGLFDRVRIGQYEAAGRALPAYECSVN